jgi:hypothetical protein
MNRRIERAKQMLLDPNQSSVDIALQTRFYRAILRRRFAGESGCPRPMAKKAKSFYYPNPLVLILND